MSSGLNQGDIVYAAASSITTTPRTVISDTQRQRKQTSASGSSNKVQAGHRPITEQLP
ncbi:hypothetical protein HEB94_001639 [Actinopolymorpha pittospori]|uniref:Uncharacterized protein n=1 Tax=Actinopolymorpha pittospori TaxID=648752 RepID=A0A927MQ24_9ACTN|nr:hypothetical protein [Actinopolymorpha pittospori]